VTRTVAFAREQLRAPFTLTLLILVPALFVVAAANALSDFAAALGGALTGDSAVALGAGWSAAFVAGTLGFFQAASSRGADRRLALAGLGPRRVALSRLAASIGLAVIASAAAFVTLLLRAGVEHPFHAAVGLLAFALLYLSLGVLVGSVVSAPLEGSLVVVFIFMLDVFSGPGMSESDAPWSVSRKAADVLIAAATGSPSPASDWISVAVMTAGALVAALAVFVFSARSRA